ncbi:hypothetical protein [Angustibacter aerolatus]
MTLVPAGAYARTVAWSDRRDWLAGVRLAVQARPELLRLGDTSKDVVSIDTFMRVLELMAAAADHDTGRDIRARKREIAAAAHCSADTVQRCRRIATRVVGCLRLVVRGRPLTMPERTTVRHRRDRTAPKGADGRRPGLTQRGVPPVYAAHTPRWMHPYMRLAARRTLHLPAGAPGSSVGSACGRPRRLGCPVDSPVDNQQPSDLHVVGSAPHPRRGQQSASTHLPNTHTYNQDIVSLRSTKRTGSARRPDEGLSDPDRTAVRAAEPLNDPATSDHTRPVLNGRHEAAHDAQQTERPERTELAQQPRRPRPARRPRRRLLGEHLAAQIAARADWGRGLSPRRVAHHLAPFEAAGWTAADWFTVADTILTGTSSRTSSSTSPDQTGDLDQADVEHGAPAWATGPAALGPRTGMHSPGGFVYWLTQRMDPGPDLAGLAELGDGHDASGATARLEAGHAGDARTACSRPDCDGHGWLDVDGPATPCPDCPPTARAPHVDLAELDDVEQLDGVEQLDPPF